MPSGYWFKSSNAEQRTGFIFYSDNVTYSTIGALRHWTEAQLLDLLTKPFGDDELLTAISQAVERSRTALAREAELQAFRNSQASLTPRERETMTLVVSGLLNKQIAAELGISEITVKSHRGKVMRKMQVASLADLVRVAAALDVPLVAHA